MDKYEDMIHIVDEENDRECWVTSDGQAHYDINEAIVRQLELINNAVHLIYKRKCCD